MKNNNLFLMLIVALTLIGCEAAHEVTKETGKVVGATTNVIGGIAEGGAEVKKGEEVNPYGR